MMATTSPFFTLKLQWESAWTLPPLYSLQTSVTRMRELVLVATTHPPFERFDRLAGGVGDAEIHQRRQHVRREGNVGRGRHGLRGEHQLDHAERGADGRFLDHGDDLVAERGQDILDGLRQHDELHRLRGGKTQRARGLSLARVDGKDARTEDLGNVGRAVEREGHNAGDEAGNVDKAEDVQARDGDRAKKAEVNDRELHEQRRRAEDRDVRAGNAAHKLILAQAHEREQQRRNDRQQDRDDGQQQRVAIARALITKPAIVLADEPTGNLDSKTSSDVIGLLKRTSVEFHQTIVMITHNDDIARLADRIIRIEDGKITGGMEL